MLSELEEVIVYKLVPDSREKIKAMWWNRLQVLTVDYFEFLPFNIDVRFLLCLACTAVSSLDLVK